MRYRLVYSGVAALSIALVGTASSCVHDEAELAEPGAGGASACPGDLTACGDECVNTVLDPVHCGACDQACTTGELCSQSMCGVECLGGSTQCGDRCVDTTVDGDNCGDCDVVCGNEAACQDSSCVFLCGNDPCEPGEHLWSRRYGDAQNDYIHAIAQDAQGNVYIAGYAQQDIDFGGGPLGGIAGYSIVLAKFDPSGAHIWSNAFGDTDGRGYDLAIDRADNVVFTGIFMGNVDFGGGPIAATGVWDAFVAKFDTDGNPIWSKRYGDVNDTRAQFLAIDASDNIVVAGIFTGTIDFGNGPRTSAGSWDGYVVKLDPSGTAIWDRTFGDLADQRGRSVAVGPNGDVYLCAYFDGTVDFGGGPLTSAGSFDAYIAKLDADGNHEWSKRFGDASPEQYIQDCVVDTSGNVFVTGYFQGDMDFGGGPLVNGGATDAFIAKFDAAGGHVWSKHFGDAADQRFERLGVASDGGVVVNGHAAGDIDLGAGNITSAGSWDNILARFDADGNLVWAQQFGDVAHQVGMPVSLASSGKIVTAGYFQGSVDFGGGPLATAGLDDTWLAAFAP